MSENSRVDFFDSHCITPTICLAFLFATLPYYTLIQSICLSLYPSPSLSLHLPPSLCVPMSPDIPYLRRTSELTPSILNPARYPDSDADAFGRICECDAAVADAACCHNDSLTRQSYSCRSLLAALHPSIKPHSYTV